MNVFFKILGKKYVYIPLIIIMIILIIYFAGKKAGKKAATIGMMALPNDQPWGSALTQEEGVLVRKIAGDLYDDLKGWSWKVRNYEPYQKLTEASDTLFVAVYNDFNQNFAAEKIEKWGTLRQWIEDEHTVFGAGFLTWSGGMDKTWPNLKKSILERMDRLNLQ